MHELKAIYPNSRAPETVFVPELRQKRTIGKDDGRGEGGSQEEYLGEIQTTATDLMNRRACLLIFY